jgi:outer membrane protein
VFEGMDERKFSMDGGIGFRYEIDNWKIELATLHDVLDRSDGNEVTATIGKVFRTGPVFIEPSIGLSYLDSNHVDYYYGVADDESAPGRPAFEGEDAVNSTLGISFITPIFFDGLTRFAIQKTHFDDSITDSPLTESDAGLEYFITYSRFF